MCIRDSPMMREEAKLYDQLLVLRADKTLASSPAYSDVYKRQIRGNAAHHHADAEHGQDHQKITA